MGVVIVFRQMYDWWFHNRSIQIHLAKYFSNRTTANNSQWSVFEYAEIVSFGNTEQNKNKK